MVGRLRGSRSRVLFSLALLAVVVNGSCGGRSGESANSRGGSGGTSGEGGAGSGDAATGGTDAGEAGASGRGGTSGRAGASGRGGTSNGGSTAGDTGDGGFGGAGEGGGSIVLPPARFDTKELAVGDGHACALLTNGTVRCWGENAHVVDVDEYSWTARGFVDPPDTSFAELAASGQQTCGVNPQRALECWEDGPAYVTQLSFVVDIDGAPSRGGLALIDDLSVSEWTGRSVGSQVTALGAGSSFSCGLDTYRHATCWPEALAPDDEFLELTGGGSHMCGLRTNHTVVCWNLQGPVPVPEAPKGEFETISSGHGHVCGLRPDKTIECWGASKFGSTTPPAGTFVDVEAGAHTTCAVREQGGVTCWGDDSTFQASPPADISSENRGYTRVSTGGSAVQIAGEQTDDTVEPPFQWLIPSPAYSTACGLRGDGSFDCFGDAETKVPRNRKFRALSAGGRAICGVTTDGLECWGDPASPLGGISREGNFTDVSVSWGLACLLDTAGTIACLGPEPLPLPASVENGTFVQVSAGGTEGTARNLAVCALRDDTSVTCWSYDIDGNLVGEHAPPGSFTHVAAGYYYACGTLTDGSASCWERGGAAVEALEGTFKRVLPGIHQNCALRSDGSVSCFATRWGNYDLEQIRALRGDYEGNFVDLSMGGDYVCGILAEDGGIQCWGSRRR